MKTIKFGKTSLLCVVFIALIGAAIFLGCLTENNDNLLAARNKINQDCGSNQDNDSDQIDIIRLASGLDSKTELQIKTCCAG